jgi:hypothetical protein
MMRTWLAAGAVVMALSAASPIQAQERLVLIGSKAINLDNKAGRDSIDVSSAKGSYQAIRVVAKDGPIKLSNVDVTYAGAPEHSERRPINLNRGDRTRPINPGPQGKFVDRVGLVFEPGSGTTTVEIYGVQNAASARAVRPTAAAAAPAKAAPAPIATAPTSDKKTDLKVGEITDRGETLFGTATVGFGVDRDVIRIGESIGKFDRIRFRILDNDIFVRSLRVVYANGEIDEVAYSQEIKANSRTRWIPLKGDRFIKEIQMVYNSKPNFRGRAFIEVYGHYAEGWLGPNGEGRKYNQGYVLLGKQTAGFIIDRNDRIEVGPNEGGFRKIRINVRDEAITLFEVRIVYGNGEVDIIPANRTRVDVGGVFGPIDLKGGTRVIREIRPTYRTRVFQQGGIARGRAVVEFWGQH